MCVGLQLQEARADLIDLTPFRLSVIPIPIISTNPNEGNTYGLMPVFMLVERDTARTNSILAPSISYNDIIHTTATFRWFYYPSDHVTMTLVGSASSTVNRNAKFELNSLPTDERRVTHEVLVYPQRDIFQRFYGIGPQSWYGSESSFTKTGGYAVYRPGYNITKHINLGVRFEASRWFIERQGVPGLALARDRFEDVEGMGGSTVMGEGLSIKFDYRPEREFSEYGWFTEVRGSYVHGVQRSRDFARLRVEAKGMWKELDWLSGASRLVWMYTPGSKIPFYEQSSLGGEYIFRGYNAGRYYDKGAWEFELEQRIRLFQTNIFGVVADWRIDPFVAVGQVYHGLKESINHVRLAAGVGFRAWVRPNVLGRVDLASGGDGLKIYVELGLPY